MYDISAMPGTIRSDIMYDISAMPGIPWWQYEDEENFHQKVSTYSSPLTHAVVQRVKMHYCTTLSKEKERESVRQKAQGVPSPYRQEKDM